MKQLLVAFAAILSGLGVAVFKVWAIISFILYLAHGRPFDWFAVWLMISCWFVLLVSAMLMTFEQKKKKSSFQERLEQIANNRKAKGF